MTVIESLRPLVDDWHTHTPGKPRAIINLPAPDAPTEPGFLYSTGIHPWYAAEATPAILSLIEERAAADPAIVAIGEAGLDRLRGPSLALQTKVFEAQAMMAERLGLPLIIHAVRTIPEILSIHRRLRPSVPWIFHGFRSGPEAAAQILRRPGTLISLGTRHNPAIIPIIPPDRLLRETDDGL